ncbi:FG-GAP repeat domain-containing protein [Pseudosporangium ferrugineum]|uniref:VCBS repeat protein n=1 Tax=Pseudosporangium ferrugineum TaxID=439699 RepID=A0A2T0RCN5_9ACTN|nr:VCBS repeat-containing protein [Pseudosporangium ferrugineum]PRY18932.1 VCBS repeat protein [Pseudosporangium ferrugineum]
MLKQHRRRTLHAMLGIAVGLGAVVAAATPAAAVGSGGNRFVLGDFGFDQAWRVDRHLRVMADVTVDRRADIVGFGDAGVYTAVSRGDGTFGPATFVIGEYGFNQGWRVNQHPRFVADITGDGRADIVGVGGSTVLVAIAQGNGGFSAPQPVNNGFVADGSSRYFLADVSGDGRADLYRVRSGRVDIATAFVGGPFATPILATTEFTFPTRYDTPKVADVTGDGRAEFLAFSVSGPIHIVSTSPGPTNTYPLSHRAQADTTSSPQLMDRFADVTGDGRADIVAFGQTEATSYTAVSTGGGNFNDFIPAIGDFGAGSGSGGRPRDVVDLNADGRADIVGFGIQGVWIALATGSGTFSPIQLLVADLGSDQGWTTDRHVRVAADITGDGRADMVGFGNAGVYTAVTTP